jgi:hypothetical protein
MDGYAIPMGKNSFYSDVCPELVLLAKVKVDDTAGTGPADQKTTNKCLM